MDFVYKEKASKLSLWETKSIISNVEATNIQIIALSPHLGAASVGLL